jgi:pyrimidine deaminase RibD-like protein
MEIRRINPQGEDLEMMRMTFVVARTGDGKMLKFSQNPAARPSVGALLKLANGRIYAARTADGGKPHAETNVFNLAWNDGETTAGATLYTTLEPCSHYSAGKTPCCVVSAEARVARVVSAIRDIHPSVDGKGAEYLISEGIEFAFCEGPVAEEAFNLHRPFFLATLAQRPHITLILPKPLVDSIITGRIPWDSLKAGNNHLMKTHEQINLPDNLIRTSSLRSKLEIMASSGITRLLVLDREQVDLFLEDGIWDTAVCFDSETRLQYTNLEQAGALPFPSESHQWIPQPFGLF